MSGATTSETAGCGFSEALGYLPPTKAQMLAACGSFTAGNAPKRRWRDDPSLMQFLRSL